MSDIIFKMWYFLLLKQTRSFPLSSVTHGWFSSILFFITRLEDACELKTLVCDYGFTHEQKKYIHVNKLGKNISLYIPTCIHAQRLQLSEWRCHTTDFLKKWGSTTIEFGPRYIYFSKSFVFSDENYMISSVLSVLSCYITCIVLKVKGVLCHEHLEKSIDS